MTLTELQEAVYTITNRSDLTAETLQAVKAATLKMHQTDYYSKDIYETGIEFSEAGYTQSLDYISLISNFRAFKYLRRVESSTDDIGQFIDILSVEETLDSYGVNRTDIAYVAGRVLEIRSAVSFQKALLGCYVLPIVTTENYSSWIAELQPYAIVYEACRLIFKMIGQDEQSNTFASLVVEEVTQLKQSHTLDVGQ